MNTKNGNTLTLKKNAKQYTQRELIIIDKVFDIILYEMKETRCKPTPEFKEYCTEEVVSIMETIDAHLKDIKNEDV